MSLLFNKIIISLCIFSKISSHEIVSIPFTSYFNHKTKTNISTMDDLSKSNLCAKILIGDPSHEIYAFLSIHHSYFSISTSKNIKNINDFQSHYNIVKSNTFKNISTGKRFLLDTNYDSIAAEKFKLNMFNSQKKEYYNISINDMIFIYNTNENNINTNYKNINQNKEEQKSYYLNIGFQIINQKMLKEREKYNFITQLKKREIIDKYDWSIFFKKGPNNNGNFLDNPDYLINAKGEILIGDLPDNYNPNNYNIEQLKKTYSIYNSNIFKWGLEFKEIFYYKDNIKKQNSTQIVNISVKDVHININNYIILSPMIYFHKIKSDFFDFYIKVGICKINQGIEYKNIICEKSDKFGIEQLKKFPTLYMEHHEFNYTFEFTYEDLFLEKDHNFWFLIALSSFYSDLEEWNMGIVFLRKYNLIFNQDTKTISFYNPNIKIKNISETLWKNSIAAIAMLVIVILLIFFAVGFIYIYICKKYLKSNKDKKRLNHIYDNNEYLKEDKVDINKKAYYQQLLVEMKGLVYA